MGSRELGLLKADLRRALAQVEERERQIDEQMRPQTLEHVAALEQRLRAALDELQARREELQRAGTEAPSQPPEAPSQPPEAPSQPPEEKK